MASSREEHGLIAVSPGEHELEEAAQSARCAVGRCTDTGAHDGDFRVHIPEGKTSTGNDRQGVEVGRLTFAHLDADRLEVEAEARGVGQQRETSGSGRSERGQDIPAQDTDELAHYILGRRHLERTGEDDHHEDGTAVSAGRLKLDAKRTQQGEADPGSIEHLDELRPQRSRLLGDNDGGIARERPGNAAVWPEWRRGHGSNDGEAGRLVPREIASRTAGGVASRRDDDSGRIWIHVGVVGTGRIGCIGWERARACPG